MNENETRRRQWACDCDDMPRESAYFGTSALPDCPAVAMAYVPFQTDTTMFDCEEALQRGTAFVALHKPFLGGKCI